MRKRAGTILKWTARIGISLWVTAIFYHFPGPNGYERADFPEMVHGQAYRPYVTRALFPTAVRVLSSTIPADFDSVVARSRIGARLLRSDYVHDELRWRPPYLREFLVSFFLSALCLVLLSLALERLWAALFLPSAPHAQGFSLLGLLALPIWFKFYSYIYDFPTVLLSAACLLMIARRRWGWYLLLFALSSINKETTVLLVVVFAIYFVRVASTERRTYWSLISIQLLILVVARGALAYVFRANRGSTVELHLVPYNLRLLTTPWSAEMFVPWGVIALLVFRHFPRKPWLLRVALGMIVPLFAFCLFFGWLNEIRDYYEVFVPTALLAGYSVVELLGYQMETAAPTRASAVGSIRAASAPPG